MAEGSIVEYLKDILVIEASLALTNATAAPLKRVKLLIQNEEVLIKSGRLSEPYKGIRDCFGRTVKNEGFISLWRGHTAGLLRFLLVKVQNYIFKFYLGKISNSKQEGGSYWRRYIDYLVSPSASDLYSLLLVYSLEHARTKLANDVKAGNKGGERQFKGLIDFYQKTLKSDGFFGLYKGFGESCACMVLYHVLYFWLYEFLRPVKRAVPSINLQIGLGTGMVANLGVYPMDTVQRRMMLTSGKSIGAIATFKQITAEGGFKSLFKGAKADILSFGVAIVVHRLYRKMFLL